MSDRYQSVGQTVYPEQLVDLAYRRIRPFLDTVGTQTRSLEHLMAEAYVQGIKDAVSATLEAPDAEGHMPGSRPPICARWRTV